MKKRDEINELKQKEKKLRDMLDYLLRKQSEAIVRQDKKQMAFLSKLIEEKKQEIEEVVQRRKQIKRSQVVVATAIVVAAASVAGAVIMGGDKETESKRVGAATSDTAEPGKKEAETQGDTTTEKHTESRATTSNNSTREYTNLNDAVENLLAKYNSEDRIVKIKIDPKNLTSKDVLNLFKAKVILDSEEKTGGRIGLLDNIVLRYFDSEEEGYKARILIINFDTGKYYKFFYEMKNGEVVTNNFPAGLLAAFDEAVETEYIEKEVDETLKERRGEMALPKNAENRGGLSNEELKALNEQDSQECAETVRNSATTILNTDLDLELD